jgi:hypothetical protein
MAAAGAMAIALAWTSCAQAQYDSYYQGYGQESGYGTGTGADAAAQAPPAYGTEGSSGSGDTWSQVGWGALAAASNLVYVPAKLVYAGLGGLTGGLALGLTGGDLSTAQQIWDPSLGGDYFLTPGQIQGEKGVSFAGAAGLTQPVPAVPPPGDAPPPIDPGTSQYGG